MLKVVVNPFNHRKKHFIGSQAGFAINIIFAMDILHIFASSN